MRDRLGPLDGLRGIAIALVVWFHLWQITWLRANVAPFHHALDFNAIPETGFFGVDLFFFISGFCLYYPYARATFEGKPARAVGEFLYRRALKILPAYLLAIAVLSSVGAHFASASDAVR